MKIILSSRKLFLLAFILIVVTNLIILSGVFLNRTTGETREITLTQRELNTPYRSFKENSGLSLRINWRTLNADSNQIHSYDSRRPAWFTVEKLEALGFEIADHPQEADKSRTSYKEPVTKEVYIVLEYKGQAYEHSLKRAEAALKEEEDLLHLSSGSKRVRKNAEEAQERYKREQVNKSRLFAIDAALDAETLKEKYSDQSQYIIAKGLVKPVYNYQTKRVNGRIDTLTITNIHVPLEYHQIFNTISAKNISKQTIVSPDYTVTLAYGSRYEPWIVDIELTP